MRFQISDFRFQIKICRLPLFTFLILNFSFALSAPAQIASGGSFTLEKSVVANGGGTSAGGAFAVNGTSGQTAAGTQTNATGLSQKGGFWSVLMAPTAAQVSIQGRVVNASGIGIRNVSVKLTDSGGVTRSVLTSSFGYFNLTDVAVGEIYILSVAAKKYEFDEPTRVLTVQDYVSGIVFTARN